MRAALVVALIIALNAVHPAQAAAVRPERSAVLSLSKDGAKSRGTPHASPPRVPAPKGDLPEQITAALRTLADEDVAGARAVIEPLLAADPDEPAVRLAAGILRFYEQRYAEAVPLIESSGMGDPAGYLALAKSALDH